MVWSNKKRLVWDARELNKLIDAAELLEKNSYGATSDLEAGYFQVGIAENRSSSWAAPSRTPTRGRSPTS